MKYLNLILAAGLVGIVAVNAAQDTTLSDGYAEVRDPVRLKAWLEANASDAESRIAAVEAAGVGGALAENKIIQGNSGGTGEAYTVSGAITLEAGVATLGSGVVSNANIAANAGIVATKFASAVQTSLGLADTAVQHNDLAEAAVSVAISPVDAGGLTNNVTIAVQASDDDPVQSLVTYWVSETAGGAASSNNYESVSITTGTQIVSAGLTGLNWVLSDTNGSVVAQFVLTAAGTNYVNVACGGSFNSAAVVVAE